MLYYIATAVLNPIFSLMYRIKVYGLENLPKDTSYIICANHASYVDPIIIAIKSPRRIYPMAKAELFKNKFIGWFLGQLGAFPVKRGEADIKSVKKALKLLGEGKVLGIFPEGTRNRSDEIKAEPGIAMLAVRTKLPIVPMAIKSTYRLFQRTYLYIDKPIYLDKYYDAKLHNEDYMGISLEIMKKIKNTVKGDPNENRIG